MKIFPAQVIIAPGRTIMHLIKDREESTMGLSTLCDVKSLPETWMRNTWERPESRWLKETARDRVEDRLGVEELTALTRALQVCRAGRSKAETFPGNLSVV